VVFIITKKNYEKFPLQFNYKKWEMLIGAPGALVNDMKKEII